MATTEVSSRVHDRHHSRRRPFSAWMKRLANLKNSSSGPSNNGISLTKRHTAPGASKTTSSVLSKKNNPYPESGFLNPHQAGGGNGHLFFPTPSSQGTGSESSISHSRPSGRSSVDDVRHATAGAASAAATLATDAGTSHSDAAQSAVAPSSANITVGGAMSSHGGGGGSTFSSPAPSLRSLTTTLTTIQSTAPSAMMPGGASATTASQVPALPHTANGPPHHHHHHHPSLQPVDAQNQQGAHFTHQFPSSPPASALPSHLAPQPAGGNPTTYVAATANNLLSDNASILTLASSSKRRRRRSMDTDASVRALAPSSLWGGSRESLPLSVLSGNVSEPPNATAATVHQARPSLGGMTNPERASVYSSSGIAPALTSERNSYYAGKQGAGWTVDGGSVKSGLLGHGRNDSITGSIGGAGSPLASPREPGPPTPFATLPGRLSRRNSGRGEVNEEPLESTPKEDPAKGVVAERGAEAER
ncbi:MAG: hypothetical protein M1838_004414 [Thelocarpon superellum]|nr:MAG: hypothetical protein M1838_004414 [Thelocarpon superellum]